MCTLTSVTVPIRYRSMRRPRLLEADSDGHPKVARFVIDAAILKDTLVLSPSARRRTVSRSSWSLLSSSLLKP